MASFDLVNQFNDLRRGIAGAPTPIESYAPKRAPDVHGPGDGHDHASGVSTAYGAGAGAPGGLTGYGSYQVDSSVAPYLKRLQAQFPGLRMTSGYRDPGHNAKVGGAKNSWHTKGRAGDFVGSAADMQKAAAWARQNGAREVLQHNAGSGYHLHVAW
jgi:hypothetical protein